MRSMPKTKKVPNVKKASSHKSVKRNVPQEIKNERANMVQNGLSDALLGPSFGNPWGEQLSQVDSLFKNNRWYLVSNMRQLLSELFVENGLVQTIVCVPVDDGLRGGVEISSKQLADDQIRELQISMDRDDDLTHVGWAMKWNRLYGGAGIMIMTDQDPTSPLNIEALTEDSPLEFRAVDMWELFWDKQNTEGYDPEIQEQEFETYNYYAKKVHKTRVMRMKGLMSPSFIRPRLRGWGFSVVESLVRSINQYLKATDLSYEVLDEFKLDIFKIKNLTNTLLSPLGDEKIRNRIAVANRQKNYQNALTMDSEDDYMQKQLSFAGLAEVMAGIRMQVASDMRMPITKLFGVSSAGFSSGEDDIENYNAMIESEVRNKCKYDILKILELKCQKMFGFIPEDLEIKFKPLRILSAVDEENVKTQKFTRVLQAKQAGELTTMEFRDICNKGNLLEIQLDTETDELESDDPEAQGIISEKDKAGDEEPGAGKDETRKPQLQNVLKRWITK